MISRELPLAQLFIQATLLIGVALVAGRLLSRCSAAVRHTLWVAAAVALLFLPVISESGIVPAIGVPIPGVSSFEIPAGRALPIVQSSPTVGATSRDAALGNQKAPSNDIQFETILFGCWLIGTAALILRMLSAHFNVRRLLRESPVNVDPGWTGECASLCAELGIRREVELRWADGVTTPTAYGTWRPVLLIPPSAREWSPEQRRLVLLHEIAHVRRRDCVTQIVAQIARAMWWPHPGAWYLHRKIAREREAACDDTVLSNGGSAHSYAATLLMCAVGSRRGSLALAGIGFHSSSRIEGRIRDVLDARRDRRASSFGQRAMSGLMFGGFAVCVAAARPASAPMDIHTVAIAPVAAYANFYSAPSERRITGKRSKPRRVSAEPRADSVIVTNGGAATLRVDGDDLVYEFPGIAFGAGRMIFPLSSVRSAVVARGGILIDMKSRPASEPDSSYRGRVFVEGVEGRSAARMVGLINGRAAIVPDR